MDWPGTWSGGFEEFVVAEVGVVQNVTLVGSCLLVSPTGLVVASVILSAPVTFPDSVSACAGLLSVTLIVTSPWLVAAILSVCPPLSWRSDTCTIMGSVMD